MFLLSTIKFLTKIYLKWIFIVFWFSSVVQVFGQDSLVNFSVDTTENAGVFWYTPTKSAEPIQRVGRYEKLEFGIPLNDSLNQWIKNFTQRKNGTQLNPFNPSEMDVFAHFSTDRTGSGVQKQRINGFYYQPYQRTGTTWQVLENEHPFRIRYAPTELGIYTCQITVITKRSDTLVLPSFEFEVVESANKGFVQVGENRRYFVQGNAPFFPVGQNLTGPVRPDGLAQSFPTTIPANGYVNFFETMKELKNSGANYFRYIACPWQTEIEYEKLGDYSMRMHNAWEFDNILDTAKALDLKMHFNMAVHFTFERPNGYGNVYWDWSAAGDSLNTPITPWGQDGCFRDIDSGYCYRKDLGLIDPVQFFENEQAIHHYKNRIRYMVARWGYSTEIAVFEILSEASHAGASCELVYTEGVGCNVTYGSLHRPYEEDLIHPKRMYEWHLAMANYMKDSLEMTNHILGVNYAGEPKNDEGDRSFYIDAIDLNSYNNYRLGMDTEFKTYENVMGKYQNPNSVHYSDKPLFHSEYGTGSDTYLCDGNAGFIRRIYLTPFTGLAGLPMTWDYHYNEGDAWKYLAHIQGFMKDIPLDQENWQPGAPQSNKDKTVELFYLRAAAKGENSKIVGVLVNRTFNYWTMGETGGCAVIQNQPPREYRKSKAYKARNLSKKTMLLTDLGSEILYSVSWYNAITGELIATIQQQTSKNGELNLSFPGLLTGTFDSPILLFKLGRVL